MPLRDRINSLPPFATATAPVLLVAFLSLSLALFGVFSRPLAVLGLLIILLGLLFASFRLFAERDWFRIGLLPLLIGCAIAIATTSNPTVFTGRDQGSIAEAAWRLAENGTLAFRTPAAGAFFDIYGPGTALNFPGFAYTEGGALITQFPLAYTSWLALFVSVFGLTGYTLANLTLFLLFGWGLFELLALFVPRGLALAGTTLGVLHFLPVWMAKFTLTENLAAPLFVLLTYLLVRFSKEKSTGWGALMLACAAFFPFVRIEGFVFAGLIGALVLFHRDWRSVIFGRPLWPVILATLVLVFLFLRDFFINLPYYTVIGKALFKKWHEFAIASSGASDSLHQSLGSIFSSYGLFVLFLAALAGIALSLYRKHWSPLLVLFLSAPTLVYFFSPSITPDHPWMLRRYFFSLYPTAVLFLMIGVHFSVDRIGQRRWKNSLLVLIFSLFALLQVPSLVSALTTTEHNGLREQAAVFAERFGERDLILIDRQVTGDPFAMIAGPMNFLLGKQAVYFFNPEDVLKIDRANFDRLYLVSPEDGLGRYLDILGDQLRPIETVTFASERLLPATSAFTPPQVATVIVDSILFEVLP